MTKVMMNMDEINGIFFDCDNHAGDHDACVIMSTLCNALVEECFREGYEPTTYNKGHVRIDMPFSKKAYDFFSTIEAVMRQSEAQYPEHIRMYT